jgi:hypothetical protein
MNTLHIRPEAHEVDTLARRQVPRALPASWEHRESTGRDYGIDMIVELFESGSATGAFLLFQIKGTQSEIDCDVSNLAFDVPVRTLNYSELFIAPILLVSCPVNTEPPVFYYLWLQEYIRIVLDHDNPSWRSNRRTARVKIPVDNRMPGNEGHLSFVANFPRRLFDWGQVGRIQHELQWAASWLSDNRQLDRKTIQKILRFLEDARDLPGIFGDPNWHWAQFMRQHFVEPGIRAAKLLLRDGPYTKGEVESIGPQKIVAEIEPDQELLQFLIRSQLWSSAQQMSTALATGNDYGLKRALWQAIGDHDF